MYSLQCDVITVLVGTDPPKAFSVHENVLCSSSEYFNRLRNGMWKESAGDTVSLKEGDPAIFQIYMYWLYHGSIPILEDPASDRQVEEATEMEVDNKESEESDECEESEESEESDEEDPCEDEEYIILAKAYVLGDLLRDSHFKDSTLDAIIMKAISEDSDGRYHYPEPPVINFIYDNTLDGSKARKFLADLYIRRAEPRWLKDDFFSTPWHKDFLRDLAMELLKCQIYGKKMNDYIPVDDCEYHEHHPNDPSTCYRERFVVKE